MKACKLCRIVNHTLVWRPSYLRAFNAACLAAIERAIHTSERSNQVELCVIAEHTLPYSYLRRNAPVSERAIMLFGKHRVWDTAHNTGVLIYINYVEHAVEIVADRLPASLIEQSQWNAWVALLKQHFAQQQFESGLLQVITQMTAVFDKVLPKQTVHAVGNQNQMSNTPIIL
jgi:uncharacterized membrane protein